MEWFRYGETVELSGEPARANPLERGVGRLVNEGKGQGMLKMKQIGRALAYEAMLERAKWAAENPQAPLNQCNCIGPQNGEPRCPCAMRGVQVVDGRYVLPAQDLGPAT